MLEKLRNSLDKGIVTIGVKSSTYLEIGKLKAKIEAVKSNVDKATFELGNSVFSYWVNNDGEIDCRRIEEACKNISELQREITRYQGAIEELEAEKARVLSGENGSLSSNTVTCSCGQINEQGAKFCLQCGRALASAGLSCRFCGYTIEEGAKFCPNCGKSQND
ncbi:zinc ribbon domain-containing protein [Flintibacter sp. KGMB00164]|uniref:zinc ribbon domain-containing protein n=1 Tax=Flintibacter sp. KGMB00164 TaxID=2610895 RepID=UPI00124695CD|nr:zinc ribbon domain-containing protein [Flintibacter sp. KGMB00164]